MKSRVSLIGVLWIGLLLGGCFDQEDDKRQAVSAPFNQAPTIVGIPPTNILEGQFYEFIPDASDPDGDELEFSVSRKPAWARFDKTTGRLSGTPGQADVGNFTNITISVSDGTASASLIAFDISVNQVAIGSATLSWLPPTENVDGTNLDDLAGYRIYYGRNRDSLTQVVELTNPGLSRFVVENLTTARWYFAMTSVNLDGVESPRSATVSKLIG